MNPRHSLARPAALAALCLGAALAAGCANRDTSTMGASGETVSRPARAERPYPNNMDDPTRATDPRSSAINPERNRGGPATGTTIPPGNIVP